MYKKILLDAPNVGALEKSYLNSAIDKGYVSTVGPFVSEFEKNFAKYLGANRAVSTQSGTTAIHIALRELGIGAGDEVIVPALTFVATVNPVIYVGATPVFVDVDPDTWNIDPHKVRKHITRRTKAIIPVHLYGNPCNISQIMGIAKKYGVYVVEDAAASLGAKFKKRHTGTFGDFGCFSFNGNKTITTGGGGMIVGKRTRVLEHIKFLANQAKDESGKYYHREIGFNERMTNIEAALGLAQLKRLDGFLEKKRTFNRIYREELKSIKSIRFQEEYPNAESAYWLSCITYEGNIPRLQLGLRKRDIVTRRVFTPVKDFPPYRKYRQGTCANSQEIHNKGLCLPSSTLNSQADIHYICDVIRKVIKR
ncbi:MAG: aminotransferase class V-fold PLP-dependent enzyme [Candidatus Omnitrophota bacterium]